MPHLFPALADPKALPRRVVVLAPHPDDEVLACGGMLAFHADRGDDPVVAFLSDGAAGDPTTPASADLARERRAEAERALSHLGVTRIEHLGFPDGALECAHELPGRVLGVLQRFDAELVYAPSLLECHADHLAAAESATLAAAARPEMLVHLYGINTAVPASTLYDISRHRSRKDAALQCYKTQTAFKDLIRMSRALDAARTINIPDSSGITDCEGFAVFTGGELRDHAARFRALRQWLYRENVHPDAAT